MIIYVIKITRFYAVFVCYPKGWYCQESLYYTVLYGQECNLFSCLIRKSIQCLLVYGSPDTLNYYRYVHQTEDEKFIF